MAEELGIQRRATSDSQIENRALLQSQRAEVVSQLAGAMANQFNNIMMAITSYAELELKKASRKQKRSLEQILANTMRATSLIQTFLTFTRQSMPAPGNLDVNKVVEETCHLLEPLVGESLSVSVKLDPSAGSIIADPAEIEALLLTLGMSARENLQQGGTLEISTGLVHLEPLADDKIEEAAASYSLITVQHTPGAMPNAAGDTLQQDPRMTRAIAAVRNILKERNGHLSVSDISGKGITFSAYFPSASVETLPDSEEAGQIIAASSTKTVLIVEDDDAVRNPAAEFLKMEGFKVLQARTGPEALRIVQESRSRLDLLVTDIVMAGMHGNKVAEELHKTHPDLKVLFMSGDIQEAAKTTKTRTNGGCYLLQKPFRLNKLNDKIHELLGD